MAADPAARRGPSWAVLAGSVALALYLLLLPFVQRTWRTTGDEPHYLLAAHSLAVDGDADLANNYANLDYLNFYFSRDIVPQVRLNAAGQQILDHYPALPWLIAPAYALGGRAGVLLLQAALGGLLVGLMCRLAAHISGDDLAALVASLLAAFSLPLLAYPYLVYPELVAAVLTTLALLLLITRPRPGLLAALGLLLALALLPWLNRRFIPLAAALALAAAWLWRRDASWRGLLSPVGVAALLVVGLSAAGVLAWSAGLSAPARTDITAPVSGANLGLRLLRGIGWLVDQQRGLFIFAPIYVAALWGLPAFGRLVRRDCRRCWLALLPFALALATATVAGGYWVAWELGPRFLVVGLPGVVALLALALRDLRRSASGLLLLAVLTGLSLLNSVVVLRQPELPYKSSLPIFYSEKSGLPLIEWLPALADYWLVAPPDDAPAWEVPAGKAQPVAESGPLAALPFGFYRVSLPLSAPAGLPPETELARLSVNYLGGGQALNQLITAGMLPPDGSPLTVPLFNARPDRWRTPMLLYLRSTGQSALTVGPLLLSPEPRYALWLPWLLAALLAGSVALVWARVPPREGIRLPPPGRRAWGIALLLPALAGGYLLWAQSQTTRVVDAATMLHFVGRPVADAAAVDGRAWAVDPATDPPQKAVYGPFEFFDPGVYRVTFRLMLPEAADPPQEVAILQVNATANFDELLTQPIRAGHFSRPNLYHDMVLTVTNPRRQALSFEVYYPGVAPLRIDGVTVERVTNDN